jgi:hypothetical protein
MRRDVGSRSNDSGPGFTGDFWNHEIALTLFHILLFYRLV